MFKKLAEKFPFKLKKTIGQAEEYLMGLATGGTLFEEMGFFYVGPINGHKFEDLITPIFFWFDLLLIESL